MKLHTASRFAALALLAGLWGCSSSKVAQSSLAYDDLYSNSTDVKAVAYSTKRSTATLDPTRSASTEETVTTEGTGSSDYYNPELAERYSKRTYNQGYEAGYNDASRWGNNWNPGWNSWNSGWGSPWGWNSWNRWNNFYSPWNWGPGLSLNFGWGGGWGWGNRWNSFYNPWGYDPFYSGWGGGFYDGFGGWGWGNRYRINNYYGGYPYGGGNVVIVNPGNSNNNGSTPVFSNPRRERANYGRSQSAYNSDADRAYSNNTPVTRGGRSAYNAPTNSSDYYSRPKRSGEAYSPSYSNPSSSYGNRSNNSYSRPSSNNNSYSRSYDRGGSSNNNTYSAPSRSYSPPSSNSSSSMSSPAGGGGGSRSRGPR